MNFLRNSLGIWNSGSLESKKAAFNLIFGKQIAYSKTDGFGTPSYSLPFRVLGLSAANKYEMVDPRGVEPLTA